MQGGAALHPLRIPKGLLQPVLASLMGDAPAMFFIIGAAIFQLGLTAFGLPGWQCPVNVLFHVPCPGCGLSTAMVLLLKGQWAVSLGVHPFAALFLAGLILMLLVNTLPRRLREKVIGTIAVIEMKTGVTGILILGFLTFWIVTLIMSVL